MIALLWLAMGLYAVATGFAVAYVRGGSEGSARLARWLAAGGFAVHTVFLAWWGVREGRLPAYTTFEALASLLWCAVLAYVVVARAPEARALPAFVLPVVVAGGVATLALTDPGAAAGSTARSWWLPVHVVASLVGAADFLLAFAVAAMYLVQRALLKGKAVGSVMERLPSLEALDQLNYRVVGLGMPVFTLALVSGVVLAVGKGPGWWASWAVAASLGSWVVYAVLLHVRLRVGLRGPRMAYLTVVGFVLVLGVVCGLALFGDSLHTIGPGGRPAAEVRGDAS